MASLLIFGIAFSAAAQIGVKNIGVVHPGKDNLSVHRIGKANTPSCLFPGGSCSASCLVYVFCGSGNWNLADNWKDLVIPPPDLPAGSQILINPKDSSECIMNVPLQILSSGSIITVAAGKKLRIPAQMEIRQVQ